MASCLFKHPSLLYYKTSSKAPFKTMSTPEYTSGVLLDVNEKHPSRSALVTCFCNIHQCRRGAHGRGKYAVDGISSRCHDSFTYRAINKFSLHGTTTSFRVSVNPCNFHHISDTYLGVQSQCNMKTEISPPARLAPFSQHTISHANPLSLSHPTTNRSRGDESPSI